MIHPISGVQRGGGERGAGPGHPRQGGIQKVKLQKFKCFNSGVTNLFETESYFLVQIHAKGDQFETHTSEIKICSICLQLCYLYHS